MALGRKTGGGSRKGRRNKASAARVAAIAASGPMPLNYLLAVMRNAKLPVEVRIDAAKAAAPYVHSKLQTITHKGDENAPMQIVISREAARW